jgi:hypothetical protein
MEFPQSGLVFLGHRSGSHLDGTMVTSVVALGPRRECRSSDEFDDGIGSLTFSVLMHLSAKELFCSFWVPKTTTGTLTL